MSESSRLVVRRLAVLVLVCSAACSADKGGGGAADDGDGSLPTEDADVPSESSIPPGDAGRDAQRDASVSCGAAPCAIGQACDRSYVTPRCVGSCEGVTCAEGLTCEVQDDVGKCALTCTPACGPGQRCAAQGATTSCIDNTCAELNCGATEACEPASTGSGFECVDNSCQGDLDCGQAQNCTGGVCLGDSCTPFATSCEGAVVRQCSPNGAGLIDQVTCTSEGQLVSACESSGDGAACSCRDDWDCPAFTECAQGSCIGSGRAPTCFLPPQPFTSLLPKAEPGFPWGGNDADGYTGNALLHKTPRSRDAAGHPFPRHAQASTVPVVANLDDDNGDGLIDELDVPEIVFTTFCDTNYQDHGVLRAVHGGGALAGKELFAVCDDKLWQQGDPILDGAGQPLASANCDCNNGELEPTGAVAVGDLDDDGQPEIVVTAHTRTTMGSSLPNHRVLIFRNTGELISDNEIGNITGANPAVTIANIDREGFAELIVGPVLAVLAHDANDRLTVERVLRGAGQPGTNNGQGPVSCVADLTGDGVMEIVSGGTVFRAPIPKQACPSDLTGLDVDTRAFCQNQLIVLWNANVNGFCAIADVLGAQQTPTNLSNKLDGAPEVVLISNGRLLVYDGATCGWDGTKCVARVDAMIGPDNGGPPNIDDFDGDGFPELGTAFATNYVMYDFQPATAACSSWTASLDGLPGSADLAGNTARAAPSLGCVRAEDCGDTTQFSCSKQGQCVCLHNGWRSSTQDASSRVTGSSVFDFNGDGAAEVVYNDECYFRIYDGADGHVYQRLDSQSPTRIEYPVVADVDSDGNAEIVFSGSNARSENCVHHDATTFVNGLQVIGDPTDRWVPARRIWNEHAYHVTNVLESGAIPTQELASWKSYNGRTYNTYRSNLPPFGNVAPDLTVEGLQVSSPDVRCGEALSRDLRIVARVVNHGDLRVGANVVVRFLDERDVELGMTTLGAPLAPGGETFVVLAYRAPSSTQLPLRVRASVDPEDAERECIESNNTREVEVKPAPSAPELRVAVTQADESCPVRTLGVQVFNDSARPVPAVAVRFYAGNPASGAKELRTINVENVPANGASAALPVQVDVDLRNVTVYTVVDPDNVVVECNDGNNTTLSDVFCQVVAF
ncbi:MAG TPA: VCBS repeat-containing protein [Polyangiales bacterium]|nr:VCBS repeat-containing protein [Polyangiales bacterium]